MAGLFRPHSIAGGRQLFGDLDKKTADEMADFFIGATAMASNAWPIDGPTPPGSGRFAERLLRIQSVLTDAHRGRARPHTEDPE